MVIKDEDFGKLVGHVEAMDTRLTKIETDIKTVVNAYHEAKGASRVFSPFINPLVMVLCSIFGAGLVVAILRASPQIAQIAQIGSKQ